MADSFCSLKKAPVSSLPNVFDVCLICMTINNFILLKGRLSAVPTQTCETLTKSIHILKVKVVRLCHYFQYSSLVHFALSVNQSKNVYINQYRPDAWFLIFFWSVYEVGWMSAPSGRVFLIGQKQSAATIGRVQMYVQNYSKIF